MDAGRKVIQQRLRGFPQLVADCGPAAVRYAKCVVSRDDLKKDACLQEFNEFRKCLHRAARSRGTKI